MQYHHVRVTLDLAVAHVEPDPEVNVHDRVLTEPVGELAAKLGDVAASAVRPYAYICGLPNVKTAAVEIDVPTSACHAEGVAASEYAAAFARAKSAQS